MLLRSLLLTFVFVCGLFAQDNPKWTTNHEPFRVIGNVYYVGSKDLASYLITTPQGHILINSNLPSSVPQIRKNIEALGFRFGDVKILLISHAHLDHCSGSKLLKQLTGAKYMVMDRDVPVVESGGKTDFQYGRSSKNWYPAVKVDRVLHDGDEVRLGGVVLVAHLTAGHTKGCTTWTMKVQDAGKVYNVVIVGGPNVNPGYKLEKSVVYPTMARDFETTFRTLNSLPCDVFLGAHGGFFDMDEKFGRLKAGDRSAFLDPEGYKAYVLDRQKAFRMELARQQKSRS
ncbi:subclass B3 metallo-beta-lactamase [Granulicella sp. S190]|uniref:subclass B3 metallo-beta-lactamase n=1 Tax=Granulicella sp. S190 TaxID=1747226 RepID=UPI00131CD743|nr:subclass B3 metallo-beta-lactamase [Granulicella sp. S190]